MIIKVIKLKNEIATGFFVDMERAKNPLLVKARLEHEYERIKNLLKIYKEQGIIKSIKRPRNKQIKAKLENLVNAKREIKKSINKIKEVYCK